MSRKAVRRAMAEETEASFFGWDVDQIRGKSRVRRRDARSHSACRRVYHPGLPEIPLLDGKSIPMPAAAIRDLSPHSRDGRVQRDTSMARVMAVRFLRATAVQQLVLAE